VSIPFQVRGLDAFFQTVPQGTTIYLPPFPEGLDAVLWLIGFGTVLILLLAALRAGPRLWRRLNTAPDQPGGFGAWLGWSRSIDSRTAPALGRILGAGLIAVAAVTLIWLLVDFFTALATPDRHDDVRNIGLTLAGLVGFPLLIWRAIVAQQHARTGQENLVTSLINKAVEGLGAKKTVKRRGSEETLPNIEVRIGAILQLERIAHTQAHTGTPQGARDHIRIMEILCAYIRENAPASKAVDLNLGEWPDWPENPSAEDMKARDDWRTARAEDLDGKIAEISAGYRPRTDIQTALSVIGRRDAAQIAIERAAVGPGREDGYRLDLRGTRLQAADLSHLILDRADLSQARLEGASLWEARLEGADLSQARLEGATLSDARMEGTILSEARLEGANLSRARLEGARLGSARLEGAYLWNALLVGANLYWARLEGANLWKARLEGADLSGARLEGADLKGARLERSNVRWADLRLTNWAAVTIDACPAQSTDFRGGRNLDQARLSSLVGNAATLLPDDPPGLYVPNKWATEPPGFDRLLAKPSHYGFRSADALRAALIFGPGEVPMKTGTPWPLDAPAPWGAQSDGEDDDAYRQRIEAWAAAQPLREPVD
jgi:uncharacterized protein YjbI with pentapeptide repeats